MKNSHKWIARFSALLKPKRYISLRTGYFVSLTDELKMYECLVYLAWTNKVHEDMKVEGV